jgi:hypothetical protein
VYGGTGDNLKLKNLRLQNNSVNGVYFNTCDLALDSESTERWTSKGCSYPLRVESSKLSLDGLTVNGDDAMLWGIYARYSDLVLKDVTVQGGGRSGGIYLYQPKSLTATGVTVTGNKGYGAQIYAHNDPDQPLTFERCSFSNNGNGVYCYDIDDSELLLNDVTISNNTSHGLYFHTSQVTIDNGTSHNVTLKGNGYGLRTERCDVALDHAAIEDSTVYALYCRNGSLRIQDSQFSSSGNGLYSYRNTNFSVVRTRVVGPGTGWGLLKYGEDVTLENTVFGGFRYGLYLYAYDGAETANVYNTTVATTTGDGIRAYSGRVNVVNTIISGSGGRYGLFKTRGAQLVHSYNLIDGFRVPYYGTVEHETEVLNTPRFVDAAAGNYRLDVGSPAINSGTDLSARFNHDLDGSLRPAYRVFEIGAYEYLNPSGSVRVLTWNEQE